MYGLKIIDTVHWRDSWSSEIGRRLAVQDSSFDTFIFEPEVGKQEVLEVLSEVPTELYQLIDVSATDRSQCEIWTDQGQCYRHGH